MSVNGYRIPSDYKNDVSKYTHGWKSPAFFTMHPGLAYVTHHRHLNAGDRVRGRISQLVQSQPMVGPLMQGFRMITIATFTPDSIIYGWMRNGVRYSPSEWLDFDKWIFNPYASRTYSGDNPPFVTASDPSTSDPDLHTIQSFVLQPGLSVSSGEPTNEVLTRVWNIPYYIGSVDSGIGSNNFCVVGRGGLFDCLGVAPGSVYPCFRPASSGSYYDNAPSLNFDLETWIAYFLSTYYYLANMQENYMYYSRGAYSLTFGSDPIASISLTGLGFHQALCGFDPNNFIKAIQNLGFLTADPPFSGVSFDVFGNSFVAQYPEFICWLLMGAQAHGGLFSVPYRPDFFNNIIKIGDSPSVDIPVIDSSGETGYAVAIPDLRFYNKVQNMMDRIFVGAGRFGDQLRTLFGTNSNPYTNKPDFLGIWQASLNPTNTVAMASGSNNDGESSTTGQMSARMDSYTDFGGRSIDYYAKESGTVMFISFLVPMPAYSQGLHPDLASSTFADDFNPEFKGLGFQSVPRWRYSMLPQSFEPNTVWTGLPSGISNSVDPNMTSVGDTVAFDWLKTDYPRLHGEFATGGYFEFWTLGRHFTDYWQTPTSSTSQNNETTVGEYYGTYINPLSWQYVFTTQSLLDPNFFVGFNFDLKVTSSVPANYMPYIGR